MGFMDPLIETLDNDALGGNAAQRKLKLGLSPVDNFLSKFLVRKSDLLGQLPVSVQSRGSQSS
jgi:hypothetical protein